MTAEVVSAAAACTERCCLITYDPTLGDPPSGNYIRPIFQVLHPLYFNGSMQVEASDYDLPDGILL